MKRHIRNWSIRLAVTVLAFISLGIFVVFNPTLSYANKTTHGRFTIFHQQELDPDLFLHLERAEKIVSASELFRSDLHLQICLNDGSSYPGMIETIQGQAFAYGFHNKVVLRGSLDCRLGFVELNGHKWNLTQLLAHEMTHCLQFDRLGLFHSNPVAGIPDWKWEGYAEYIARQKDGQNDLASNLALLRQYHPNEWGIQLGDGTIAPRNYFESWMWVQYCLDVEGLTFLQLLEDPRDATDMEQLLNNWFDQQCGASEEEEGKILTQS